MPPSQFATLRSDSPDHATSVLPSASVMVDPKTCSACSCRSDDAHAAVTRCSPTLGRISRSTVRRLANDVLLLLHGIRDAFLWDHTIVDEDDCTAAEAFMSALREHLPAVESLLLVRIGPSLFVAAADALLSRLSQPLPGSDGGAELVAVDAWLPAPRNCDKSESSAVQAALGAVASELCCRLETRGALHVPGEGAPRTLSPMLELAAPEPTALMTAVHGWLLGYPLIYCYATELAAGSSATCLSGRSLIVVRVTALPVATERAPPQPHLVCSFSMPAEGRSSTEDGMRDSRCTQRWRDEMTRRFAAQSCWMLDGVTVQTCMQEHVVV